MNAPVGVIWQGDLASPDLSVCYHDGAASCLWTAGFIANRTDLVQELGCSGDLDDPGLLLAAYVRYGEEVAERLAGPFSWLLWDPRLPRLVLCRDRQGAGRIFFRADGTKLAVAAEPTALLGALPRGVDLDESAVLAHLCGRTPLDNRTFFLGVEQLEAGEQIVGSHGRLRRKRYWSVEPEKTLRLPTDRDYADRLLQLLRRVVREYVTAEKLALTVSGGMDSSSLAALIRTTGAAPPVPVIWVSPTIPQADEEQGALAVCERLGLAPVKVRADHHRPLSGGAPKGTSAGPETNYYPELWARSFELARASGATVLWTGAGGDVLFGGGIPPYADLLLELRWFHLARQLREELRRANDLPLRLLRRSFLSIFHGYRVFDGRSQPLPPWVHPRLRSHPLRSRRSWVGGFLPARRMLLAQMAHPWNIHGLQGLNCAADSVGIQLRHPFLDHRLFEFAASLPVDQVSRCGLDKFVLRQAMHRLLPEEVLQRRQKILPSAIYYDSLRQEESRVRSLLRGMISADLEFVQPAELNRTYERFLNGAHLPSPFWLALTLEAWLRSIL